MALFSKNPIRSAATAAVVVSVAHFATKFFVIAACFPADPDVNRDTVHFGTFIYDYDAP